jgi:eukaryotic-like serine/threonine-protein kinase
MSDDDETSRSKTSLERDLGSMAHILGELAATPAPALAIDEIVGGHYVVEGLLGTGSMGVVHLAHDRRLDRRVALKLGSTVSPRELLRLEREAVILAQLTHPNVVVLHEVGRHGDRLFLAMEYVDGGTLRAWLAASPRTVREITALFAAVGDGLAVAHARGLVHRDIKPENILVGADGRPRIADFGVAIGAAGSDHVAGTPAYMAPEQVVDARADQFSFAATLWEALHGMRPLPDATAERTAALDLGVLAGTRKLPPYLDHALRRALSRDPADRWPDVAALVRELRIDPTARRRKLVIAASVLAVGAVAATTATLWSGTAVASCEGASTELARTWNPTRADAITRAFSLRSAQGAAWAAAARDGLDRWGTRWTAAYTATCRATRVSGTQSEELLDRRMACLGRSRRQAEVVIEELATGEPALAGVLGEMVATISDPGGCDAGDGGARDPYPTDTQQRRSIEAVEKALATARVQHHRVSWSATRTALDRLVEEAAASTYRPARARAELERGLLCRNAQEYECAQHSLRVAFDLATAAGDDRLAIYAAGYHAGMLVERKRASEAAAWVDIATALIKRLPDQSELEVFVLRVQARFIEAERGAAAARASWERADALALVGEPDDETRAGLLYNRGTRQMQQGAATAAVTDLEAAIVLFDRVRGGSASLDARYNLVAALYSAGEPARACAVALQAVMVAEAWFGSDHIAVAAPLFKHGQCLQLTGEAKQAIGRFERATELTRRAFGADAPETLDALANLASGYCAIAQFPACVEAAKAVLAAFERTKRSGQEIAMILSIAAYGERNSAHFTEAATFLERALAVTAGEENGTTANLLVELAHVRIAQKQDRDASALLERAAAICDRIEVEPHISSDVRLTLARQLAHGKRDPARVRSLARAAKAAFVALDPVGNAAQIREAEILGR